MTENEYLTSADPYEMFGSITAQYRFSERKLRLFAVACAQRVLHLLPEPESEYGCRAAFAAMERRANEPAAEVSGDPDRLIAAAAESCAGFAAAAVAARGDPKEAASYAAHAVYAGSALTGNGYADTPAMVWSVAGDAGLAVDGITDDLEVLAQTDLVLDIFGNPFRPPVADPTWATTRISALATAIDRGQSYEQLPDLADALEAAGCKDGELLRHCRLPRRHVRGCWAIDLLLNKHCIAEPAAAADRGRSQAF